MNKNNFQLISFMIDLIEIQSLKGDDLQRLCSAIGMAQSGTKEEKIQRLLSSQDQMHPLIDTLVSIDVGMKNLAWTIINMKDSIIQELNLDCISEANVGWQTLAQNIKLFTDRMDNRMLGRNPLYIIEQQYHG
jgi:hypothetical protein